MALIALVTAGWLSLVAQAGAHHQSPCVPPGIASFTADPPNTDANNWSTELTVTMSGHFCTGDTASIVDDTGAVLYSTTAEYESGTTFFGVPAIPGTNQTRTYTATVNGSTQTLQVVDQGWIGSLTLSAAKEEFDAHDMSTWLTLTVDRPVPGPYVASVYDDQGQRIWVSQDPSPQRVFEIFAQIPSGEVRTYTAYVAQDAPLSGPPSNDVRASDSVTLVNRGWLGNVRLSANVSSVGSPGALVWLKATLSRTISGNYYLSIYDETGARRFSTGPTRFLEFETPVIPGTSGTRTYTAYVASDAPSSGPPQGDIRAVSSLSFIDGQLTGEQVEGVALDELVQRLAGLTDAEVMLLLSASPAATHTTGSVSDQALAYEAAVGAGMSRKEALLRAAFANAAAATGTHLLWDLYQRVAANPTPARPATPTAPLPIPNPIPANPIPAPRDDSYENWLALELLARYRAGNPNIKINAHAFDAAARECLSLTQHAISKGALAPTIGGGHPCEARGTHIYFPTAGQSGKTEQSATHDHEAVSDVNPAWVRLNYVNESNREARGLTRNWYAGTDPCRTGTYEGQCHEFPYFSSAQSGPGAHLNPIPTSDNLSSGGSYSAFTRKVACPLTSGGPQAPGPGQPETGSPFLVIPLPQVRHANSFGVCPGAVVP